MQECHKLMISKLMDEVSYDNITDERDVDFICSLNKLVPRYRAHSLSPGQISYLEGLYEKY